MLRRPDALESAESLEALNVPGFNFHPLRGKPTRYSLHVNGPWSITFEWDAAERGLALSPGGAETGGTVRAGLGIDAS